MMEPGQANFISRGAFVQFMQDPEVACRVANQLSRNYFTAYEAIRTLGLTASPSEKFAKLLLSWSAKAQSDGSAQIKLTHRFNSRQHCRSYMKSLPNSC